MTVIDSCGCVFCDLGYKPKKDPKGRRIHIVQKGYGVQHIECTRRDADAKVHGRD